MNKHSYSPETADKILNRIMDGEMLTKICAEDDMPTRREFYGWMANRPDLKDAYARARLAWADWWAERVLAISLDSSGDIFVDEAGKAMIDHANVQRARLQTDNIKWLVGKYAPRTYGDKPVEEAPQEMKIRWIVTGVPRNERSIVPGDTPAEQQPPKQITNQRRELPAGLTDEDWSVLVDLMEEIRRTIPGNSDRPPKEIFGVMKQALLEHFRETAVP
jgi:hypothetical protein